MITNDDISWHYFAVKKLSRSLRGITSNHNGNFYCLNCLHSYRTEKNFKNMKKYAKIMSIAVQKCQKKILKYNSGENSLKAPFTIYEDLGCILTKIHICQNDLKKYYTEKKS